MNILEETKLSLLNKLKGYFTYNVYQIALSEQTVSTAFANTYEAISVLSRCIDLIINTAAEVEFIIVEDIGVLYKRSEYSRFERLLARPSSSQSELDFRKQIYRDLIFQGNNFIYHLGDELQILDNVEYTNDDKPIVGKRRLEEHRLAHTRLLTEKGRQYGTPYLKRIDSEISLIAKMLKFQENFFKNHGFPGVILESDHPLSKRTKENLAEEFMSMFAIMQGNSSKPFILDNSMKMKDVQKNFRDLQFIESINNLSSNIISSLGVPEVLIKGGNNANISPNVKIFVYMTVAPFVDAVASELTKLLHNFYPGTKKLKVVGNYDSVKAVKDDFLKLAGSVRALYTVGLISQNEGRRRLGYEDVENGDTFLTPANISGSNFAGDNTNTGDAAE